MSDEPPGGRPPPPRRRGGAAPPPTPRPPPPPPPPPRPLAWLFVLLPLPVILTAFPLVFLSFPTGRVPSIRWRPAAVLAPAAGLTLLFAFLSKQAMVGGGALGRRGPRWTRCVTG